MRPLLAATATADKVPPWLIVVGTLLAALLAYIASCRWWPFARCWCCRGTGKHSRRDGQVFRRCRWCKASGARLRIGRRVWDRFAAVRKAGS